LIETQEIVSPEALDGDKQGKEEVLRRQMSEEFERLRHEFADISPDRVAAVGKAEYDGLRAGARILEFIPVLVHRYAREDLLLVREREPNTAA
jgi:hypothetical protein